MANPSAGSAKDAVATPPAAAAPPLKSTRRVTVSPSYAPTQPRSAVYGDFFFLRFEGSGILLAGGKRGSERNYRRHFTVNVSTGVTNPGGQSGLWLVRARLAAAARAPGPPAGESAASVASQSGSIASGRPSASAWAQSEIRSASSATASRSPVRVSRSRPSAYIASPASRRRSASISPSNA